ncbi:class I mannose-6-phosphate isomerase [Deinococcus humi]|uniref:Mannose-6-phosphate isomerase class I n=1 Tax=Deinococcus humi TaxID=662880 RepID=A0A7W8NGA9_9DEIO|nr:class I mannose-6-phosphate isomerase [Deinococcus humi]MBB5364620.1 mannose-6-phosphate isomerase class I [Deinococcus humi]GGO39131.1 mannose-6-phosphate isomerase [Deinococcus humi]
MTIQLDGPASDIAQRLPSNYDKFPKIAVPGQQAWRGWPQVLSELRRHAGQQTGAPLIVVDTYPGTDLNELQAAAAQQWPDYELIDAEEAALDGDSLGALLKRFLTPDRVLGVMAPHTLREFYDADKLEALAARLTRRTQPTLVYGWGASLAAPDPAVLVLADLARWEIQMRLRSGQGNWHAGNGGEDILRKYKRGFFVEWRVADRHKQSLSGQMDFYLETNTAGQPMMIARAAYEASLNAAASRPFRTVPFFDPGIWGGQWLREVCDLDRGTDNFAWGFDGVPEENSVLFDYGREDGAALEMPAQNLVLERPRELLGEITHARFGTEFPIRFDFLDTIQGGNLSLQVHPLTAYIQQHFGMSYTQDESYYLLDADETALVYLGLKNGVDKQQMLADLQNAQQTGHFDAERYVNALPARKHDHFSIPAGTVHCSGSGAMVLEISATPYIFTFKLWDWGRVGLDGQPRPIHLQHGAANIQWERDADWVEKNLLHLTQPVGSGEGWREESTGLSELEFIETRRHWFSVPVHHDTHGTVNILNLVEGREAVVQSPTGAFEPFTVHYAETFIVPAAVGEYVIRPAVEDQEVATIKAYVRGTGR